MADATFQWNGGTGSAGSASNWTLLPGGVPNSPNIPQSDDDIIMTSGDAQFDTNPISGMDNGTYNSLVSFQGGTIDMMNTSGSANGILQQETVQVTNSTTAVATLTSSGASTLAGTIDADTNGNLTFSILSGSTSTNTGVIEALNGGTLTIGGPGTFVNNGTVVADTGGYILVNSTVSGTTSYWSLGPTSGGTIEINTPIASSQNNIFDFPGGGELKLDQLATFGGDVFEPGSGDLIDLGMSNVGTLIVASTGNPNGTADLQFEDPAGGILGNFFLDPFAGDVVLTGTFTYGAGGSSNDPQISITSGGPSTDTLMSVNTSVACFMAGTRIATDQGEVAVEDLQVGNTVKTTIGGKPEKIVWIGQRTIDCARHPQPKQVWPVRISAGAFGRGKPSRDLWLSPDHAIYIEDVLIPVKHLINGSSIAQVPCTSVTYYHIELRHHDVVLANGMTAETFLAGANDGVFADKGGPVALHPDLSSRLWEAEGCAPLVVTGPALEAARRQVKLPGRAAPARRRAKAA